MSWGEVFKINSNMKRPINEQLRDMKFQPIRVITTTNPYVPEKNGIYKVICVGAGGNGGYTNGYSYTAGAGGGGGGVAIKTMRLSKSTTYNVTINTSSTSFKDTSITLTANCGNAASGSTPGTGGTATGGDSNYTGQTGGKYEEGYAFPQGGSVGVYISDLYREIQGTATVGEDIQGYTKESCAYTYGGSLLSYGGGGTGAGFFNYSESHGGTTIKGLPGAVIVIPLEMEE